MTRLLLMVFSCLLIEPCSFLFAQTTFGVIRGTIRDSVDAVMVGVAVTITNEGTNIARQTISDEHGNYEVGNLNPGLYTVVAEAGGFQRHLHRGINLETGQILRIDVSMKVGDVVETVSVTGEAPLIETETGAVSDVRTGRQLVELPSSYTARVDANSGGIYFLLGLSPGNIRHQGTSIHTYNGSRAYQSQQLIDGTQLGDQRGNQVSIAQPSLETIQEMKVLSVNSSAEYGSVASVVLTSRSGTNQLHGAGFHQYSSNILNARNFFSTDNPWRVLNMFGGRVGGPVVVPGYNGHNKTFFFVAYEGNRDRRQRLFNASVPTLALRQGDFSAIPAVVRDPTTGQPFADKKIPALRISPISAKIQELYPKPNFGPADSLRQNLNVSLPDNPSWNTFDTRIDHRISAANSLFGRFGWRRLTQPTTEGSNLPNLGYWTRSRTIHNLSLVDTHVISPRMVNELRAGYAWHELPQSGPRDGFNYVRDLGIQGLTNTVDVPHVFPSFSIQDFETISTQNDSRPAHQVYDLIDNVTIQKGRHSLKVGFNYRRNYDASINLPASIYGTYSFTNAFTGYGYADFLLGIPQTTSRSTAAERKYGRNQVYVGYAQDDFKVRSNLTLNLGLRYEWMNPFAEIYDRMYNFDQNTGAIVVPTQEVIQRYVSPILPNAVRVVTADQAGFPRRGLRKGDNNNFDPRFGIAWRPFGNAQTVVRGGFGVYHNVLSGATFGPVSDPGPPFASDESFVNRVTNGIPLFQFPRPFLTAGSPGATNATGVDPNLFAPYTLQWNLTVEREIAGMGVRASYIANHSVNLLYGRNINQPLPSVVPFDNNRRSFPQYGNVTIRSNGAGSRYNSLQIEAERKLARGLEYMVGWTWAKQLANGKDSGALGSVIENAYNRAAEWGDDEYFIRHRVVSNFIWETPMGPGRKWLGHGLFGQIIGGWNLTGIALLESGQRFTPSFSGRDPSNTNIVSGRPDRIANGNLPPGQRTLLRWFDVSAFVVPPVNAGRFGNSANAVLEGPGTQVFSFGVVKTVTVRERLRVSLSINTTNTFNHANFRNPNANISSPSQVGLVTAQSGVGGGNAGDVAGPRTVVVGTRIDF